MRLSRKWSAFLVLVGVWTWVIWPRLAVAIWDDSRSWTGSAVASGSPTGFFWVHALLIAASLAIGTTVGVLGIKGWRASTSSTDSRSESGGDGSDSAPRARHGAGRHGAGK